MDRPRFLPAIVLNLRAFAPLREISVALFKMNEYHLFRPAKMSESQLSVCYKKAANCNGTRFWGDQTAMV